MGYYKEHAKEFIENTFECDMSELYRYFEKRLNNKGVILDIGFGSGRDSIYFKTKGYTVYSIDPEEAFINHAKTIGLCNVYCLKVEDMAFENMFDGIWACASLLHVNSNDLSYVFKKCYRALKQNGIMYVSFKKGEFEGIRNSRYYLDLTEESLNHYLQNTGLKTIEIKTTEDVRKECKDIWINAILIKEQQTIRNV